MHRVTCAFISPVLEDLCRTLLPQPLQLPQHDKVRIQEAVDALPHTGLLIFVELSVLDRAGGDAFAETCVCQAVDGCYLISTCSHDTG
jgi:hypothetical protein